MKEFDRNNVIISPVNLALEEKHLIWRKGEDPGASIGGSRQTYRRWSLTARGPFHRNRQKLKENKKPKKVAVMAPMVTTTTQEVCCCFFLWGRFYFYFFWGTFTEGVL